jgi:hypothetical protein
MERVGPRELVESLCGQRGGQGGSVRSSGGQTVPLFRRETLLRHESAHNHLTDTERSGGLLHGDPQPPVWRRTGRKAVCVADMLHALLCPSVAVASAIAQPVQDRNNRRVFTD